MLFLYLTVFPTRCVLDLMFLLNCIFYLDFVELLVTLITFWNIQIFPNDQVLEFFNDFFDRAIPDDHFLMVASALGRGSAPDEFAHLGMYANLLSILKAQIKEVFPVNQKFNIFSLLFGAPVNVFVRWGCFLFFLSGDSWSYPLLIWGFFHNLRLFCVWLDVETWVFLHDFDFLIISDDQ